MDAYNKYLTELESVLKRSSSRGSACSHTSDSLSSSKANSELRRLIPIEKLREAGAFFTGVPLALEALKYIVESLDDNSIVLDPTCGAGELLLLCADNGPKNLNRSELLKRWSTNYLGRDLHGSFVDVAKLRLLLSMAENNGLLDKVSTKDLVENRSNIVAKSIFDDVEVIGKATHVVLNPPYTMIQSPDGFQWSSGKVNAAAVFLDTVIRAAKPNTRIAAILPDVLRSGSRYARWRGFVSTQCRVERIRRWGRFDEQTDVHVFMLDCIVKDTTIEKTIAPIEWVSSPKSNRVVGDLFDVSVGSVVHYRDLHKGQWSPYLISKGLPVWEAVGVIQKSRRYLGRKVPPPFVVVRRVSRPEDTYRARPTMITGKREVAVDNHLIVLKPRKNTIKSCSELLAMLKDERTKEWLDQRIRCRHLTVGALKELPWWEHNL